MAIRVADSIPADALRFEPYPRWIRAHVGSETAVDSRRAVLVWEPGHVVPVYAFPRDDVRADLVPAGAVRAFDGDPELADHVTVRWDAADSWYEEDEPVIGHPSDPFKRIDVRRSSRHVTVAIDGTVLADTRAAVLLFETGLPTRYYIPPEDVRRDLLEPSERTSICAYKGEASYWSARIDGELRPDVAWTYREPLRDGRDVRDLICFFNERTDITVDGEPAGRPATFWS
jgi:uncharacterized protein (DUF427 family)